jgi:hypothetical protein
LKSGSVAPLEEDPVGDQAGEQRPVGCQERRERHHGEGQEAEAVRAVRVRGHEAQLAPRHLPEEAYPHDEPEIPAKQEELEQREAHIGKPPPGRGEPAAVAGPCIPGRHIQGGELGPDIEDAAEVHEGDEQQLRHHRAPQPHGRDQGDLEPRPGGVPDQASLSRNCRTIGRIR